MIPFQLFLVKTILTISVKVTDLCRGDILTSNKIFDIMAHSQPSEIHHSIKVDGTVQYTLQKESLFHRDPLSAFLQFNSVAFGLPLHFICTHVNEENNHM